MIQFCPPSAKSASKDLAFFCCVCGVDVAEVRTNRKDHDLVETTAKNISFEYVGTFVAMALSISAASSRSDVSLVF